MIDLTLDLGAQGVLEINRLQPGGLRRFTVSLFARQGEKLAPVLQAAADGSCRLRAGRAIRTEADGWVWLDQLRMIWSPCAGLKSCRCHGPSGVIPGGYVSLWLTVASPITCRGSPTVWPGTPRAPLGYDFWDMDPWPYDGDTAATRLPPSDMAQQWPPFCCAKPPPRR